ncbi:MAG: hypothetical protein EBR23_07900, partial [Planctomycetia bacterium]|nr:hypothetical protein [Planctomycetia bacterium]
MLDHLDVPQELQRNAPRVRERGADHTGEVLIRLAMQRCGLASLAESDVLDVGCGVRFTQALINRRIPFKSYSGVEVHRPIVDFLKASVEPHDPRFRYAHWNVRNARYNQDGIAMAAAASLPVPGTFGNLERNVLRGPKFMQTDLFFGRAADTRGGELGLIHRGQHRHAEDGAIGQGGLRGFGGAGDHLGSAAGVDGEQRAGTSLEALDR